jgi:hypothetical protein
MADTASQPDINVSRPDLCQCGRYAYKIHCPSCGSAVVLCYATRFNYAVHDGKDVKLRVFRCRKCGNQFNDDDWQLRCQAPSPQRGASAVPPLEKGMHPQARIGEITDDATELLNSAAVKKVLKRWT